MIFFLVLNKNICCGYSLEAPHRGTSNKHHNICLCGELKKKYQHFLDENITKTCLYNVDPIKPHFYIAKLGFIGVYIIFLISVQNID